MQLFFTNNTENEFTLSSEESKHICKVLRKKDGDTLNFTDGKGNLLIAKIMTADSRKTRVSIVEKQQKEKPELTKTNRRFPLHLAQALGQ